MRAADALKPKIKLKVKMLTKQAPRGRALPISKSPAAAEQKTLDIVLPTSTTARRPTEKRNGEPYLLDGRKKYIIGISGKRGDNYKDAMEEAMGKLSD